MKLAYREILGNQIHLVDAQKQRIKTVLPSGPIYQSREPDLSKRKLLKGVVPLALGAVLVGTGLSALFPDSAEAGEAGPKPTSTPISHKGPAPTPTRTSPELVASTNQTPEVTRTPTPEALTAENALKQIGILTDETRIAEGTFGTSDALVALTTVSKIGDKNVGTTLVFVNEAHVLGVRLSNNGTQPLDGQNKPVEAHLKVSQVINNKKVTVLQPSDRGYPNIDTSKDGVVIRVNPKGGYLVSISYTTIPAGVSKSRLRTDDVHQYTATTVLPDKAQYTGVQGLQDAISDQLHNSPKWDYAYSAADAFQRVIGVVLPPTVK